MATKRIKDISTTATTFAADDFIALDASSVGTRKMAKASLITQVGANYLEKANNLSDVSSAAASRDNLEVLSNDELARDFGTKLVGPSLSFDGTNDFIAIADDDKLSFTDGVDDLPFSISGWVKMDDATSFEVLSKFGPGNSTREWVASVQYNDDLRLYIQDTSGNYALIQSADPLTTYEGQWVHLAWTYAGAGPNSANAFTASMDGVSLYVNGVSVALDAAVYSGTYTGMSNTAQPVHLGRVNATYADGQIKDVKLFNRELSAAEVTTLYNEGQLGLEDQWGGGLGDIYTSDFSAGVDGFSGASGGAIAGNIDSIGPVGDLRNDTLRFTLDTSSGTHYVYKNAGTGAGKRCRLSADIYIPSTNSNVDGVSLHWSSGASASNRIAQTTSVNVWERVSGEFIDLDGNFFYVYGLDGAASSFQDATGTDVFYLRNIKVTEIGTLADFRAENFDTSTGKLYDISDNAFVGTSANLPSLVGREFPVYTTGTWTPTITFGGGSTGITYSAQEGTYTRIGDTVHLAGIAHVSGLGSATGTARVSGLPYTTAAFSPTGSYQTVPVLAFDATGLTSALIGLFEDSQPDIILYQTGSSGGSAASHSNFTTSTSIRFSGTYQIQ
jgi:hypothetical protein